MASRYKIPFHIRLFVYLLSLLLLFLLCFLIFQYSREKTFKAEKVNYELQENNIELYYFMYEGGKPEKFVPDRSERAFKNMRITLLDTLGHVLYDSFSDSSIHFTNHLDRHEIKEALDKGEGYTVRRQSKTTNEVYYYSATLKDGLIIRSAIPYSPPFDEMLSTDKNFLWFMMLFAVAISIFSFMLTRRLGQNITRLREFAIKAKSDEIVVQEFGPFPNDELGDISNQIVDLYAQLRKTQDALSTEHNRAIHQEQEQIRIKKQLTQNINHEIKTPVSSIQGYLETIINNPDISSDKLHTFIQKSYEQSIRLAHLLQDISTITRMDEGSEMIEKETINLSELIRESVSDTLPIVENKGFTISCDIPDGMVITGNQTLLHSIFRNLIDNALSYSGGNKIAISLVGQSDDLYILSLSDNGVGIAEEHLTRIFERFYRIDKGRSRKLGGTGLGLSIVKNAVLLHGGTISARPCPDRGLEFVFSFKKNHNNVSNL